MIAYIFAAAGVGLLYMHHRKVADYKARLELAKKAKAMEETHGKS